MEHAAPNDTASMINREETSYLLFHSTPCFDVDLHFSNKKL